MTQQVGIELHDEVREKLFEIPSVVTFNERQLALHWAASQWDGTADVFENGPLLGGATRALGMGMMFNERRDPNALLWTYDWFSFRDDNPLDVPPEAFDALVKRGLITKDDVAEAQYHGTFEFLFAKIHSRDEYSDLLRPRVGYLPGHRGEVPLEGEAAVFRLQADQEFKLAFVDGCKSWYGTKHWFREIVEHLRHGADLLFQDYGHYTCFWLPMLMSVFQDSFEMTAYVDRTYVFRLQNAITAEEVERGFPDEPEEVSRETYDVAFDQLVRRAKERGDRYAAMIHEVQRAAAYAYIGLKDEARPIVDRILMLSEWMPLRDYLKEARISPTYTPEGKVFL